MAKGLIILIILSIILGFFVLTIFDVIPDYLNMMDFVSGLIERINSLKI